MKTSIIYAIFYLALLLLGSCSKLETEEERLSSPDKLILYAADSKTAQSDQNQ